jgi:hypothetical protein
MVSNLSQEIIAKVKLIKNNLSKLIEKLLIRRKNILNMRIDYMIRAIECRRSKSSLLAHTS